MRPPSRRGFSPIHMFPLAFKFSSHDSSLSWPQFFGLLALANPNPISIIGPGRKKGRSLFAPRWSNWVGGPNSKLNNGCHLFHQNDSLEPNNRHLCLLILIFPKTKRDNVFGKASWRHAMVNFSSQSQPRKDRWPPCQKERVRNCVITANSSVCLAGPEERQGG